MVRRRWWIAPSILALALILSIAWGYREYQIRKDLEITLDNYYQRIFFDVKKHVENVQTNLSKAMVANSAERNVLLLSQIMNEAYFAQDKLAQMPVPQSDIANTQKFLNQAADYSYYLIETHLEGVPLTKEQRGQLASLRDNSAKFNEELSQLQSDLADKNFVIGSLSNRQTARIEEGNENIFQTTLVNIDKNMANVPRLIYDGPFADEMQNRKAVGISGEKISREVAERKARDFFGENRVGKITAFEEGENIEKVAIPSYTFSVELNNVSQNLASYIAISKQGGHIVWMRNPRPVNEERLSIEEAQNRAKRFLEEKGFKNMEVNYYQKYNGGILFNFAHTEDDVTIYPDLVKVKVALDNGEIIAFDAVPYYTSHQERNIPSPKLSLEEARARLRDDFEVNSSRLAIIPKGKNEILCYEFKGTSMGDEFIVYINADNGSEEDVLQLVISENGTLTF
jgi:spore germination protein